MGHLNQLSQQTSGKQQNSDSSQFQNQYETSTELIYTNIQNENYYQIQNDNNNTPIQNLCDLNNKNYQNNKFKYDTQDDEDIFENYYKIQQQQQQEQTVMKNKKISNYKERSKDQRGKSYKMRQKK
ncbi:hypothetical protein PPERSA_02624 [Pseudocohnilembus persalinus]|uniref:Uncharacterized protein n=1 Tax=Pseudocohnilembus persalinus TaxID=266149 RepID=A0A0V0R6H1_PSEPJ|nr:hypothetical protein PPERSA_02624 [Pseudocohnilembus persalinus]|eukprot:KRX09752.1 hypothetical protein PPERSA_02624 [Pseudocohnilembus persalinus]